MLEFDEKPAQIGTNIKIFGVGGAGGNAINTMIDNKLTGVEFISANTDMSDLVKSRAKMKLQLGKRLTRGLGTGANPELGERSAEESKDEIRSHIEGADMVFIAAGMGGGTGTGGAPVIAKLAREMGILTLGIVSTPFPFEGQKRKTNAEEGIRKFSEFVDTLIIIPNSKLCEIYSDLTLLEAFHKADNVLYEAAKAVSDIINVSGLVNVDFADVRTVMQNMGYALMGTGISEGEN
ncbi:MAG: cell division protein FtsZ, partial [Candidatus Syntrophosphaera sp.]